MVSPEPNQLLLFAEARLHSCADSGPKALVLKKSSDGGSTWSPTQVVFNDSTTDPSYDGLNLGAATVINDGEIIGVHFVECAHKCKTSPLWYTSSTDMGKTWSSPTNLSQALGAAGLSLFAPGPSGGSQSLSTNAVAVPGWYKDSQGVLGSTVLLSSDAGSSWSFGGKVPPSGGAVPNECTAAYSETGDLVLNMRNEGKPRVRLTASSSDDGKTFGPLSLAQELVDPACDGDMVAASDGSLVLSHASSATSRSNGTLFTSDDGSSGSWSFAAQVNSASTSFGYSALAELPAYTSGKLTFAVASEQMAASGGVAAIVCDQVTINADGR